MPIAGVPTKQGAVSRKQLLMSLAAGLVRMTPQRVDWTAEMHRAAQDASCAVLGLIGLAPRPEDYEVGLPRVELMHDGVVYAILRGKVGNRMAQNGVTISSADRENLPVALGALTEGYQRVIEALEQPSQPEAAGNESVQGDGGAGGRPEAGGVDHPGRNEGVGQAGAEGEQGGGDSPGGHGAGA